MRKKICVLLVLVLLFVLAGCGGKRTDDGKGLSLSEMFRDESGAYIFRGVAWDSAKEEVAKQLSVTLGDPVLDGGDVFGTYVAEEKQEQFGKEGELGLEFMNGGLTMVSLEYADTDRAFYDEVVEQLQEAFGDCEMREIEEVQVTTALWENSGDLDTFLQAAFFVKGEENQGSVKVTVGYYYNR